METKKVLVAFNPAKPTARSKDFLAPIIIDGVPKFMGLSSGRYYEYGMVVMTGKPVTVNDIFAKIIDLGSKVESVSRELDSIAKYFELVNFFKIGNVLRIKKNSSLDHGFDLEKTSFTSSEKKKRLP